MTKENILSLSPREQEVALLLISGQSYQTIASTLFISKNTVKFHCKNIYKKLSVNSRVELIIRYIQKLP